MSVDEQLAESGTPASTAAEQLRIFISYRRSDAGAYGLLLFEKLAARFGKDNVFLDVHSIEPGTKWLEAIRTKGSHSAAFLALIGPRWAATLTERAQNPDEEDFVRAEIESALRAANRGAPMVIIPVLLDEATVPTRQQLPQSLWPLLGRETMRLSAEQFEADIEALIGALEQARPTTPAPPRPGPEPQVRTPRQARAPSVPPPDNGHYEDVVDAILRGSVVIFLGPAANSCDRSERWADAECGFLPDGEELAAHLADRFGVKVEPAVLARVAQYVTVAEGPGDLFRILRTTLAARPEPTAVHRFLAGIPRLLNERGLPEQHQLIVTTNWDNSLEDAFIEAEEPFDLAVYIASEGQFAHFPYDGVPTQIPKGTANEYKAFPIDQLSGDVSRTVIMKIHGAVDREQEPISWHDNYVITEDDYISYLTDVRAEAVVPSQITSKLWYSHFLFLGYAMRDWNLRVFLHRMLGKRELSKSWAIQRDPDRFDARFWDRIHVDLYDMPLAEYVHELDAHLVP